jgi:L-ascorbate metabolism protein UlaG (beta-lactamase superfamily)
MKIRWYGQSAFLLTGEKRVAIDPFGPMAELAASRGIVFEYPAIEGVEADVLLVTHEHADHNAVDAVDAPVVIRSTAGTIDSPLGEVVAVASEHDDTAGTQRGPNTIFRFTLDGLRVAHLGDLGQQGLRPEQIEAIGDVDVLLIPVGGGPTVGGEAAAAVVRALNARVVVPMHYRTDAVNFLDPPDEFLDALGAPVERLDESEFEVEIGDEPKVVLLAVPTGQGSA